MAHCMCRQTEDPPQPVAILYDSFEEDAEACEDCNKADHTIHGIPPLICLGQEVMLIRLQHRRFEKKHNADVER